MPLQTIDTFYNGHVRVEQAQDGYRFSIDAVLLAHHARPRPQDRVLDLGTGCGIIPLLLAYRWPQLTLYGVEIQQELAQLARANVRANAMQERITILHSDLSTLRPAELGGPVDLVVSNPPFRKIKSGRINPNAQRAVARHEIKTNLLEVLNTVRAMLRTGGRLLLIYAAERGVEALVAMQAAGLEPKFLRTIHARQGSRAKLLLIEAVQQGRAGLEVGPPLIIYRSDGAYTAEVAQALNP
jgi:tRNA1Val (adenine37-N6)-methyltransferase